MAPLFGLVSRRKPKGNAKLLTLPAGDFRGLAWKVWLCPDSIKSFGCAVYYFREGTSHHY